MTRENTERPAPPRARARGRLARASAELEREALRFLGRHHRRRRRVPSPGAVPGAFEVPTGAPVPVVRALVYGREDHEDRVIERPEELRAVISQRDRIAWIDVQGFGDRAVLEDIAETLEIHPLALADIVNAPQRAKVESYGDRLLIVAHMARTREGGDISVEQVSLVLGPGFVASFQELPGDVFDPVRDRIRAPATRVHRMGADYLAYSLLDAVIDGYFPVVEAIGEVMDTLEREVVDEATRATVTRVHALRRTLLNLHRLQWQQRDAVGGMLREDELPFSDEVRIYLRDTHDHAIQTLDVIETYREMSISLMDLYLSSASHRMNETMKALTVVATLFIPMTFITGVYGMNFDYMPELHQRWAYPAVWAAMLVVGMGLLAWFRARGWIQRPSDGEDSGES